jgi:hypothetical protein
MLWYLTCKYLLVERLTVVYGLFVNSYWIGSQMTGQPIYMYRLILPFDEKILNVGTDMDCNLEGDFKTPINDKASLKGEFQVFISCRQILIKRPLYGFTVR